MTRRGRHLSISILDEKLPCPSSSEMEARDRKEEGGGEGRREEEVKEKELKVGTRIIDIEGTTELTDQKLLLP